MFDTAIPERLIDVMNDGNLIVFTGAGLSKKVGLPTWTELVRNILNELPKTDEAIGSYLNLLNIGKFTPLQILSLIENEYKQEIYKSLINQLKLPNNVDLSTHKNIFKISSKVITTNYDKLLESSAPSNIPFIPYNSTFKVSLLDEISQYIFKIHGCIEYTDSCILFESDYKDHYGTLKASSFELQKIFKEKTILFIGFSLSDPFINDLFQFVSTIYESFTHKHYIITDKPKEYESIGFVTPIALSSYDDLDNCLDQILKYKVKSTSNSDLVDNTVLIPKILNVKSDIKILYADPIDKKYNHNVSLYIQQLLNFDVRLESIHLSLKNLQTISESDYIFIFTQIIKNQFVIEDEYLKSKLIKIEDLKEYTSENIKSIFFFYTGEQPKSTEKIDFPIMLIDANTSKIKDLLASIVFKAFKKADINLFHNSRGIINIRKFRLTELKKGYCEIINYNSPVSDYIDKKNLLNFIGRNTDLENLIRKILENVYNGRIITIKGSGGIGKTTLISKAAIEIAKRNYFEKGVHFIPCDVAKTFESFKYHLSICFDLSSSEDLKRQIAENFEYKSRLIILDNFESILYSSEKQSIMELISFASDYACLVVTSRQLLELEYEDVYELRSFTSEEGLALFKSFYNLYKQDEEVILKKDIIERILNNNPLAIKLIARGLPANKKMSILKDELEVDIFEGEGIESIFEDPEDSNIERSKSLYHSINYSYQQLNQKEKLVFEIISLFPDGIYMENLKNSFKENDGKMIITDKDIKQLDNKSLLENSNAYIKLQSIVNRFAEHQFKNRSDKEKQSYYLNAFLYNDFVANVIYSNLYNSRNKTLKMLDTNISNFTKCLNYITRVNVPDERKFNFIHNVEVVYRETNQPTPLLKVFTTLKEYYKDEEKIMKYLNLATEYVIYWTNNFDGLHEFVNTNYPFDKYKDLDEKDIYEYMMQRSLNSYYFHEGFSSDLFKVKINGKFIRKSVSKYLFQLGYLEEALIVHSHLRQEDFFIYEAKCALGVLTEKEIDLHLKSIYIKDTLSMTQHSYVKQKISKISSEYIKKLSITNPYTKGLINLMLAVNTNDVQMKCSLFESAISNLKRIKYYYTEAILQYSKFLYEKRLPTFESWFNIGKPLAQKYEYRYLLYQFDFIIDSNIKPYTSETYPCSISKKEIDAYIKKYISNK